MSKNLLAIKRFRFSSGLLFIILFAGCLLPINKSFAQNFPWAQSSVGTGADGGWACATDSSGNVYATGRFNSPTITFGSVTLTNVGGYDIYLVKYDANGNVLWATSAGGTGDEDIFSVSVDDSDNAYITGDFGSPAITFGITTLTNASTRNIYVVKYDGGTGNVLWAQSATGSFADAGFCVCPDNSGHLYVSGYFYASSITFGGVTLNNANGGSQNLFLVKYDKATGTVLSGMSAGGSQDDGGMSLSIDKSDNVYMTGYFKSSSITFGSITLNNAGGTHNFFIVKFDPSGNALWADAAIATDINYGYGVSVDNIGHAYVTGFFNSSTITLGSYTLTNANAGSSDVFVAKFDGSTGNVLWAKSAGGTGNDIGFGVGVSSANNIYVSGSFTSPSITFGSNTLTPPGGSTGPMFIVQYDSTGNVFCASALASANDNWRNGLSVDTHGNAYVTGDFGVNPFILGANSLTLTGTENAFTAKYSSCSDVVVATVSHINPLCSGQCTGTASVNVSQGAPPFSFVWNTGDTTQNLTGLCAATYSVTVTDSLSNTFSDSVTISQPPLLAVSAYSTPSTCDSTNGTAAAIASGGTGSYSYTWSTAPVQTTQQAAGLVAGNYSVTVSDSSLCTATAPVMVGTAGATIPGVVTALRDTLCEGTKGNLSLAGNSSNIIQWQSSVTQGNFTDINSANSTSYQTLPLSQTTYYRVKVGTGSCVSTSDSIRLFVPPVLTANFGFTKSGTIVTFSDSSVGDIISYFWTFGDGTTSTAQNPVHPYSKADTTYNVCLTIYDGSNCSYTFCEDVDLTTGIASISALTNWSIYPNPFSSQLLISGKIPGNEKESIEIDDLLGRTVLSEMAGSLYNNPITIDVSDLARGIYFLKIRASAGYAIYKVVKE